MTFDVGTYKALALRTKAPFTEKSGRQLIRSYELFKDILEESRDQAPLIDKLKRYGIYGKDDDELVEQLLPTYPTGDKAERIRQCVDLIHGLIGIIGECGEMAEVLVHYIDTGEGMDVQNIREESSDIGWFLNLILAWANSDIPSTLEANIRKLARRFPTQFTLEDYSNRDKPAEMLAFDNDRHEE